MFMNIICIWFAYLFVSKQDLDIPLCNDIYDMAVQHIKKKKGDFVGEPSFEFIITLVYVLLLALKNGTLIKTDGGIHI